MTICEFRKIPPRKFPLRKFSPDNFPPGNAPLGKIPHGKFPEYAIFLLRSYLEATAIYLTWIQKTNIEVTVFSCIQLYFDLGLFSFYLGKHFIIIPASIITTFFSSLRLLFKHLYFHLSRFHLEKHFYIVPASINAIFFSSFRLLFKGQETGRRGPL